MPTLARDAALVTTETPGPDRYLPFYGLAVPPFPSTADPERLWLGNAHRTILDTLARALRDDCGIALLTGDAGTGKTSLSQRLISMLGPAAISVGRVSSSGAAPSDFFEAVLSAFGVRRRVPDKEAFAAGVRDVLAAAAARGDKTLLVVDEAQGLGHALLRDIGDLSASAAAAGQPLVILLIGETRLAAALRDDRHAAVRERIVARCGVPPLVPDEVGAYLRHCLEAAGAVTEIFTPEATQRIASLSRGVPGAINTIAERALLVGCARRTRPITEAIVGECGRSPGSWSAASADTVRSSPRGTPRRSRRHGRGRLYVTIAATALFVTGAPYLVWWLTGLGGNSARTASNDSPRPSRTPAREDESPALGVVALPPAVEPPNPAPSRDADRVTLPERRVPVSAAPVEAHAAAPAASGPRMAIPHESPVTREGPAIRESSGNPEHPANRQSPVMRESAATHPSAAPRQGSGLRDAAPAREVAPPAARPAASAAAAPRVPTPEAASPPRGLESRADTPDPSAVIDWLMKASPGRR